MQPAATLFLPYQTDATEFFARIKHLPWAQLLDSCNHPSRSARYDILVADPQVTLIHENGLCSLYDQHQQLVEQSDDAFALLQKVLQQQQPLQSDLPFCGGLMGYWGYDLLQVSAIVDSRPAPQPVPEMAVGLYDWAIVTDHQMKTTTLVGADTDKLQQMLPLLQHSDNQATASALHIKQLTVDKDFNSYQQDFARIQHYLREGDCYQVNYARCFSADCTGDPWQSYQQLRKANPVPFAAYLQMPFASILCSSPERFIRVQQDQVLSSPIKGTRRRHQTAENDLQAKEELKNSPKDHAENLMIVDLIRNDLGKSCIPGSIDVPALFDIETFPTVFHMTSHIQGTKHPEISALQVFKNCFPGGSVTGAPKKRAMQIIQELESVKRQVYCGSIAYISRNGNMDSNITIRTMTVSDNKLVFWAGGGIVADSQAELEFAETEDKARAFFDLLGIQTDYTANPQ